MLFKEKQFEIAEFLDLVHRLVFLRTQHFGNWSCFFLKPLGWMAPTILDLSERDYLTYFLTNTIEYMPPTFSLVDGNRYIFRNIVFFIIP
jgi:hypothetical protein